MDARPAQVQGLLLTLTQNRGMILSLCRGFFIDRSKYSYQKMYIVDINGYAYMIPLSPKSH